MSDLYRPGNAPMCHGTWIALFMKPWQPATLLVAGFLWLLWQTSNKASLGVFLNFHTKYSKERPREGPSTVAVAEGARGLLIPLLPLPNALLFKLCIYSLFRRPAPLTYSLLTLSHLLLSFPFSLHTSPNPSLDTLLIA